MFGKTEQKVFGKSEQDIDSSRRYSRLPKSILHSKVLSLAARCVYAELAMQVYQGSTVKVGQRRISANLGIHLSTVNAAIQELIAAGVIVACGSGKERRTYVLISHVFGSKQRSGVEEVISSPSGGRRLASVRTA